MIGHQAVGMHSLLKPRSSFGQQTVEFATVLPLREDVRTTVAPKHHMVNTARHMYSRFARHDHSLNNCNLAGLTHLTSLRAFPAYKPYITLRVRAMCVIVRAV